MRVLDHGVLNVPLAKRGDLARQAARSVSEENRAQETRIKADRAASRALFREARKLIEGVSDERMAELGLPHGLTVKQTRAQFVAIARRAPARMIKNFSNELAREASQ